MRVTCEQDMCIYRSAGECTLPHITLHSYEGRIGEKVSGRREDYAICENFKGEEDGET